MDGSTASSGTTCSAPTVEVGRPESVPERTVLRRFVFLVVFLVSSWALLTLLADRASAEESPSAQTTELVAPVEPAGAPNATEEAAPSDTAGSSGADGATD